MRSKIAGVDEEIISKRKDIENVKQVLDFF